MPKGENISTIKNPSVMEEIFAKSPDYQFIADAKGKLLYINDNLTKLSGYSKKQLQQKTVIDLIRTEDIKFIKPLLSGLKAQKKRSGFLCCVVSKDRKKHYMKWHLELTPKGLYGRGVSPDSSIGLDEMNRIFVKNAPVSIAIFDKNLKFLGASDKWIENYKLRRRRFIGESIYDVFPNTDKKWRQVHRESLKGKTLKSDEEVIVSKDGSVRIMKWEVKPWYLSGDKAVGGIIIYVEDITAGQSMKDRLSISEETFRGSFEHAYIGMALIGAGGEWLKVNRSLSRIIGYSKKELLNGMTFMDITHPDDLNNDLELFQEVTDSKRNHYQIEKRYIHKSGKIVWALLTVSVVKEKGGKILYFISQINDITETKKAFRESEEASKTLRSIFNASTHVALVGVSPEGIITSFNKGGENILGYRENEVVNKKSIETFHVKGEVEELAEEIYNESGIKTAGFDTLIFKAKEGVAETREWTFKRKNGSEFPALVTMTPIRGIEDKITGYLKVITDISLRKAALEEIKSLYKIANEQNERLKNFAHIVSHNLRSHSVNLTMLLELLIMEYPDLAENEDVKLLTDAAENLQNTINDLSEVALITSNQLTDHQDIDLYSTAEKAIGNITALSKASGVEIINQIEENTFVKGLQAYLDSILMNFLTNSVKYSSPERKSFVILSTSKEEGYLVLQIHDNGLGIDMEKNGARIFGMYKTFHGNKDAKGLGLFITKNQVEALGGKIDVKSEVDVGTTFKIYLKNGKI